MNILFLAGTLGQGGAERQLFYLCKILKEKSHQVKVLCLTKGEFYENEINNLGIEVIYVGESNNRFIRLFEIIKTTKKIKPDLIYGFHFYTNIYSGFTGRILGIRSFGSIRNNGIQEKKTHGFMSWFHYSLPHRLIANSWHGIRNAKKIFYKRDIKYLPNYIDLTKFEFKPKLHINNPLTLTLIGRFFPEKQIHLFIDLISMISEKMEVKAVIIGDGLLKDKLVEQAKGLPIEFIGLVKDVTPYLYQTDYLVSTSKNEGTPNVMLEAIACGVPIVALYHDGIEEWVNNKILPMTEKIQDMVNSIVNEPSGYNLSYNYNYICNNHDIKNVYNKFITITHKE